MAIQKNFSIKKEEEKEGYGRFVFEPLEQGYGHTLGSALRRVLLLSLPGAAATFVRFSSLKHQFGTINGVKEDGVDLILNVKQLRFIYEGEKPVRVKLSAKGKGRVSASSLKLPAGVKIANPGLVLATLSGSKSKLEVDIQVERGTGYSPAEDRESSSIGLIPIDADFSPVGRVRYKVEETRVGRLTNFDRLTLEIWTDATIKPSEALRKSAEILTDYLQQVIIPSAKKKKASAKKNGEDLKFQDLSVEELGIPTRIANALSKAGYEMVRDLLRVRKQDLVGARNLGEKSLGVIEAALKKRGLKMA